MPPRKKNPAKAPITGSLNSKTPNPYELAYKQVWDATIKWKQIAIAEDIAAGKKHSRLHDEFTKEVCRVAEEMFTLAEKTA